MPAPDSGMTVLLMQASRGDENARSRLFNIVQDQLRAMATNKLRGEQAGVTIQATMLVHDAYLQLIGADQPIDWSDRKHFYVLAAKAMRRILVDHARGRRAAKRGGPQRRRAAVEPGMLADRVTADRATTDNVLALHDALKRLAELDSRQADIVELRHFGGYSVAETADLLNVSERTVKSDFAAAKAWLFRELSQA
ncbi:MAG: ECF-type sigma factor [Planctomycetota bacterium]